MKNRIKKSMALLLAVIMLLCAVPINRTAIIVSSAASYNYNPYNAASYAIKSFPTLISLLIS